MFSSKDDLKEFGSQMYAVVICQQSKDVIKDSIEELMKNLNHKVSYLSHSVNNLVTYSILSSQGNLF